jgi:hypothetical protein
MSDSYGANVLMDAERLLSHRATECTGVRRVDAACHTGRSSGNVLGAAQALPEPMSRRSFHV